MDLLKLFPGLRNRAWAVTSPPSPLYNCVAWAAGDATRWWWPDAGRDYYWPPSAPREETIEAFVAAFALLGYEPSSAADEPSPLEFERVALFARDSRPEHMARELATGEWTSKCGRLEDITHALDGVRGSVYGAPVAVLRRPRAGATP
jgi:hypothetical protein